VTTDQAEQGGRPARQRAEVIEAASAALGRRLSDPVGLQDGDWTVVFRCQDPAGGTVIVKAYPRQRETASSFASEAAGLELASGSGLTPDLLAAGPDELVVVMADLGSGPSLADVLLGDSAPAARHALLSWAAACGQLAVARGGREAELAALRARYSRGQPDESYWSGLDGRIRGARQRAAMLDVPAPAGLDAELAAIAQIAAPADYQVFSPGDICPDNNLLAGDGVRFLDFEAAGYHSVFLDAAYLRMPFSTCWCVFRLPAELSAAAESAYRQQVTGLWPELADDAIWQPGVRRAVAAWTLSSMWWLLGRTLEGDSSMNPDAPQAPHTRQLMRHRWTVLAAELEAAGEYPALAGLARSRLSATGSWNAAELPLYPALR
jgi:hypothetical protein